MDMILPVSEARAKLPQLIKKVAEKGRYLVITKNGRPEAVLMSPEELEALEIRGDAKLVRAIAEGLADAKAGRTYSHEQVFKHR